MRKGNFGIDVNSEEPDQPAGIYSLVRSFAVLRYVLQYLMLL